MIAKLLTKYHSEFLSLKGGCRGSPESTLVKMSNCWKSHDAAHYSYEDQDTCGKVTKRQENTKHMGAKRSALSPSGDHKAERNRQDSIAKATNEL